MYYSDSRTRRQSLVYFWKLVRLIRECHWVVPSGEARGYVPGPLLSNIWSGRTTRMYSEFESFFGRYRGVNL